MKQQLRDNSLSFLQKHSIVFLFFAVLLSFFFRFYLIPSNLFFGPEQGRDFLVIRDIVVYHKMTLIGSKTDVDGIFHGPIFYYLATIPFILSHGDPVVISAFFIFIQSLTVVILYKLGQEMFGKRIGILAAILFIFSYGAIVYARWLSNPPLSMPLGCLFVLFFWRFFKGNSKYLLLVGLTYGLLGQSEFINYFFYGIFTLLLIVIYRKKFLATSKLILLGFLCIAIVTSTFNFVLFDVRHEWLISKSILSLILGKSGFYLSYVDAFKKTLETFLQTWTYFIYPHNFVVGIILLGVSLVMFVKEYKHKDQAIVLYLWLFVPLITLLILKHDALEHLFLMSAGAYILLLACMVNICIQKQSIVGYGLLILLVVSNMLFWKQSIGTNRFVTFQAAQPDLYYQDEQNVIQRIYKLVNNQPFEIQAYTIPYWSQQAWEYLFWYDSQKNNLNIPRNGAKNIFVIVQKDISSPLYQKEWLDKTVNTWGMQTDSFHYGILEVKQLKKNK